MSYRDLATPDESFPIFPNGMARFRRVEHCHNTAKRPSKHLMRDPDSLEQFKLCMLNWAVTSSLVALLLSQHLCANCWTTLNSWIYARNLNDINCQPCKTHSDNRIALCWTTVGLSNNWCTIADNNAKQPANKLRWRGASLAGPIERTHRDTTALRWIQHLKSATRMIRIVIMPCNQSVILLMQRDCTIPDIE